MSNQVAARRAANGNGTTSRAAVKKVVEAKRGIILDIGCGEQKWPNAVGMDHQALAGVDVVHNWNVFPWPFEDESVTTIIASHVVEHVNPADGHFLNWMNECWRVLRPNGQIAIATPYGSSQLYLADPTHCNPCSEMTWAYFDPGHPTLLYTFYHPKPFWIEKVDFNMAGIIEVVLRKREDLDEYKKLSANDVPDVVKMPTPGR